MGRQMGDQSDVQEKILFTLIGLYCQSMLTLGNALKYTLAGSVRVELRYSDTEAILRILDTGVGFPCMYAMG